MLCVFICILYSFDSHDSMYFAWFVTYDDRGRRKAITLFGGGVGLGSSWTQVNMELEKILK